MVADKRQRLIQFGDEIGTHTLSLFANANRFLGIPRFQTFQNECLDGRKSGPNLLVAKAVDKKPPSALPLLPVGTQSCIFSQNFPEGLWVSRHKLLAFVVQNPLDHLGTGRNQAQRPHQPRLENVSKPALNSFIQIAQLENTVSSSSPVQFLRLFVHVGDHLP